MNNIAFSFLIACLMTPAFLLLKSPSFSFVEPSYPDLEASPLSTSPAVSCIVILTAKTQLNFPFSINTFSLSTLPAQLHLKLSSLRLLSFSVSPQISHIHVSSSFFQSFLSKPHLYFHLLLRSLALANQSSSPPFMYIPYFVPPNLFGTNSIYQILSLSFFIYGIKTSPLLEIQAIRVSMSA